MVSLYGEFKDMFIMCFVWTLKTRCWANKGRSTNLPIHIEDERKQPGHGDAYQVERAEIGGCADLLAAASEHAWKLLKLKAHRITTYQLIPQH